MNNRKNDVNQTLDVALFGDEGVGKTKLCLRLARNEFWDEYRPTIGADIFIRTIRVNDTDIKLRLWDTAGAERFREIICEYVNRARVVYIVFDLTNEVSFNNIRNWMNLDLQDKTVILVGAKSDLVDERVVKQENIDKLCSEYSGRISSYVETSSRDATNIDLLREESVKLALNRTEQKIENTSDRELLVRDLQAYITRVESHRIRDKESQINFKHGFWHHRDSRALNREANYELAKKLLNQLTNTSDPIQNIFKDIAETRNNIFDGLNPGKKKYKNNGINSSTLNKIITKAKKVSEQKRILKK